MQTNKPPQPEEASPCVKPPDLKDKELGSLRSLVLALLVLVIVYLGLLLPWSPHPEAVGGAIGALAMLVGGILGVGAWRNGR